MSMSKRVTIDNSVNHKLILACSIGLHEECIVECISVVFSFVFCLSSISYTMDKKSVGVRGKVGEISNP